VRSRESARRLFVWFGGLLFVLSLGLTGWWYAAHLGGQPPASDSIGRGLYDILIFSIFATHHSAFARSGVKAAMTRLIPADLLRTTYVIVASILLGLVCVLWRPIGRDLYQARGLRAAAHAIVQLIGVWLIATSVGAIDPLELAGIRKSPAAAPLQTTGPYRVVRHPLYLGWILLVFGVGHMTGDRLLFAAVSSGYLVVAVPWEERSLVAAFGEDYTKYQTRVKWRLMPYVY
jgi:protein-S-isoprenylcysteine O-methyltransferase Ste14